ncbi:hypothetical protein ASPZODRAFT_131753 [Penicilliopsis zonata CBS 506.65]|uniref:Protein-S-isoprenylcysteine O-methyltransferase n=1 Tax=Penicilliopsis zonata CBS 506.65 TaxID=1073090 RepID=A0A1L9SI17_9EURO|nr:hypothetical protein ASPZODRAFT_131753 [Penicilliopsis zonata CBS 506.65]OJJ46859.1 hypothetical protein ASPZODRAFT_131753 [Penicilliopsis zonata CBS 506.65]
MGIRQVSDRLQRLKIAYSMHYIHLAFAFFHVVLPCLPAAVREATCPAATEALNPALFTWSGQSAPLVVAVIVGSGMRLLAFAQLGKNFTFVITRPSGLIRSGLYAYMQHPSYTGLVVSILSVCGLVLRPDGVPACWSHQSPTVQTLVSLIIAADWVFILIFLFRTFSMRVVKEEAFLRRNFGKEWEDYHFQTARFIPWLF